MAPMIKGLRTDDFVRFARANQLSRYLPIATKNEKPPKYQRQWLVNVCYTLKKKEFVALRTKMISK